MAKLKAEYPGSPAAYMHIARDPRRYEYVLVPITGEGDISELNGRASVGWRVVAIWQPFRSWALMERELA